MGIENKNSLAVAVLGLLAALNARAEVAYQVEGGVGQSDNISRVSVDEIDETLASVGLVLEWQQETSRIDGQAFVDLSYVEYLENTYDAEVLGTATADVTFSFVPERFTWQLQDEFGQSRPDPFSPVTPDNLENINNFSTGPDLYLHFGQAMIAQLSGRYYNTNYEKSGFDADRTNLALSFGRQMSVRSKVAINFVADATTFDDPDPVDYKRRNAFLSYELGTGGRTTINARAGYTWLDLEGGEQADSPLFGLDVTRQVSPSSTLSFSAAHEFSDAGQMLSDMDGESTTAITSSGDPFQSSSASLGWQFSRSRTSFGLTAEYFEQRYENQTDFDSDRASFSANFGRVLRPTLTFNMFGNFVREDFLNFGEDSDEWIAGLTLDWDVAHHLGFRLRVERSERTVTDGIGEYVENRAWLSVTWTGDRAPSRR